MRVIFSKNAKKHFNDWEKSVPRNAEKIDELIEDILKIGFLDGIGKPEQLRHFKNPSRFSRHINQADRLVYCSCDDDGVPVNDGKNLYIVSCKGHYDDK